jgi:hypothetical protein
MQLYAQSSYYAPTHLCKYTWNAKASGLVSFRPADSVGLITGKLNEGTNFMVWLTGNDGFGFGGLHINAPAWTDGVYCRPGVNSILNAPISCGFQTLSYNSAGVVARFPNTNGYTFQNIRMEQEMGYLLCDGFIPCYDYVLLSSKWQSGSTALAGYALQRATCAQKPETTCFVESAYPKCNPGGVGNLCRNCNVLGCLSDYLYEDNIAVVMKSFNIAGSNAILHINNSYNSC